MIINLYLGNYFRVSILFFVFHILSDDADESAAACWHQMFRSMSFMSVSSNASAEDGAVGLRQTRKAAPLRK